MRTNDDLLRSKRELRLRISRSRRRIDRRLRAAHDRAGQLLSWRTYVVRHPFLALTAAFGVGLAASAGLKPGQASRRLGLSLVRHVFRRCRRQFWTELRRTWTEAHDG